MHTMAEFSDLCNQFEQVVKKNYELNGESPFYFIENRREFQEYRHELLIINSIRNNFAHEPFLINNQATLEVADVTYEALKQVIEAIQNPPIVEDLYINIKKLLIASLDDSIKDIIGKMRKRAITHVPVLDSSGKLFGVFSENTIFSRLCDEEIVMIDENELIRECSKYLPIDQHESEYFGFVGLKKPIADVKAMFDNPMRNDKRLVMLIVTKTGRENQKVEGIITPWDLINE